MALRTRKQGEPALPDIPPPISIRRLRAGDDAVLTYLAEHNAAFGTVDEREPLAPLSGPESVAFLSDDRTITLVAFAGQEPVGFVYALELYRRHTELRHLCIYEIGVSDRHRNMGIGQALLDALGDYADGAGISRGFVITHASDTAALQLYEAAGGYRTADDDVVYAFHWES